MFFNPEKNVFYFLFFACFCWLKTSEVSAQRDAVTITSADAAFSQQDFHNAFFGFESLYKEDTNNNMIIFKAGVSAVNLSLSEPALYYLKKCNANDEELVDVIPFWLARAYHLNIALDSAIFYYEKFLEFPFKKNSWEKKVAVSNLKEAKNLRTAIETNNVQPCVIKNLGPNVNSEYVDHSPLLSKDGKTLFFTTRRPSTTDERILDGGEFFEKIFVANLLPDNTWSRARPLFPLQVEEQNMSTIQLIENDTKLLVYLVKGETKGVFICQKMGEKWLNPVKYEDGLILANASKDANYASDNKMVVFTRNNHSNTFQYDIAFSVKDAANNTWSRSISAGKNINTNFDEVAPYFSQLKSTMFYSSKGENGYGDFDLRKAVLNKSTKTFANPSLMPYPVNTPGADLHLREVPGSSRSFVMASARAGSFGTTDIYLLELTSKVKVEGIISNQHQAPMANMRLEISDSTTFLTQKVMTNDKGQYTVTLMAGVKYSVSIFADKEFVSRTEFQVPRQPEHQDGNLEKNFLIIFPPEEQP